MVIADPLCITQATYHIKLRREWKFNSWRFITAFLSLDSLPWATLDVRSLPAAFSLLKKTKADSHHGYMSTMVVGELWWRKSSYLKCLVNIYVPRRSFEIVITKWYNEKFWLHLKRSYLEKIKYFVITIICFLWYAWFSWHAWSLARRSLIKHICDDRFCPSKHKSGK